MKGFEARAAGQAKLYQRIALNAAFQTAILTRAKDPRKQAKLFDDAIDAPPAKAVLMAEKLRAYGARFGAKITVTKRGA